MSQFTAEGAPDASFGSNGSFKLSFAPDESPEVVSAQVQPDGKIVLLLSINEEQELVVRLTASGALDAGFDGDGKLDLSTTFSNFIDLQIQPDNKVLVFGVTSLFAYRILRINTNGSIDAAFGGASGLEVNLFAFPNFGVANGLKYLSANELLIYGDGQSANEDEDPFWMCKINASGSLVTSYAANGVFLFDPNPADSVMDDAYGLALGAGGEVFANGAGRTNFGAVVNNYVVKITANGLLDNSFSGDGLFVQTPTVTGFVGAGTLHIQPNGKLLIGGTYAEGIESEFSVMRLNTNGTQDGTWNTTGISRFNISKGLDYGFYPFTQATGNVVLAGIAGNVGFSTGITVARFNTNGVADFSFGTIGFTSVALGTQPVNKVSSTIAKQDVSGNVILAGGYKASVTASIFLTALAPNGSPVLSFGNQGTVALSLSLNDAVSDIEPLPSGKLLVAVTSFNVFNKLLWSVLRFNADGTLDTDFGQQGKAVISIPNFTPLEFYDMVVLPNGNIAAVCQGGGASIFEDPQTWLVRLTPNGTLDAGFFGTGYTQLDIEARKLLPQPDNKLVVAGTFEQEGETQLSLRRFLSTTGFDNSFNGGNKTVLHTGGGDYEVQSLNLTPTGQVVVGTKKQFDENRNFFIAAYTAAGLPDGTVGTNGLAQLALPLDPKAATLSGNQQLLIGGEVAESGLNAVRVGRYSLSGTIDPGFGTAGLAAVPVSAPDDELLHNMHLQADGKILLAGITEPQFSVSQISDAFVARLNNAASTAITYTFITSGNWDTPANWQGGVVPPNPLPEGSEVIINPTGGNQECILNVPVTVPSGAFIRVRPGKKFTVNSQLTVPAFIQQ